MGWRCALIVFLSVSRAFFASAHLTDSDIAALAVKHNVAFQNQGPFGRSKEMRDQSQHARDGLRLAFSDLTTVKAGSRDGNELIRLDAALQKFHHTQARLTLTTSLLGKHALTSIAVQELDRMKQAYDSLLMDVTVAEAVAKFPSQVTLAEDEKTLWESLNSLFPFNASQTEAILDTWEVKGLFEQLSKSEAKFAEGLVKSSHLFLSSEQLVGVPEKILAYFPFKDGTFQIDASQWWQVDPVLRFCSVSETRNQVWVAARSFASVENEKLQQLIVAGRSRIAKRFRFRSWVHYTIGNEEFSSASLVAQIHRLKRLTDASFNLERKKLAQYLGHPPSIFDVGYLREKELEQLGLDDAVLKKYFSSKRCIRGILSFFETEFDVEISQIEQAPWVPSELYCVFSKSSGAPIGCFALDLFARKGKTGGFYNQAIAGGFNASNGRRNLPFSYLHANFTPPKEGEESFLSFEELWTLLHEFGHVLHSIFGSQRHFMEGPDWLGAEWQEVPSIVLEKLAWEPEFLAQIAYDSSSGTVPDEKLLASIRASRELMGSHQIRFLLAPTVLDLKLHSARPGEVSKVEQEVYSQTYYPLPGNVAHTASDSHFIGYPGTYWTYLWAESIAAQVFSRPASERRKFLQLATRMSGPESIGALTKELRRSDFHMCSALLRYYGIEKATQ